MSKPRKTLIITDDEDEVLKEEEQNPFSFKQFLLSKNLDSDQDQDQVDSEDQDQVDSEDQDQDQVDSEDQDQGAWGRGWASGGGARAGSGCAEEEVTRFDSRLDDDEDSRQCYEGDDETSVLEPGPGSRTRTGPRQVSGHVTSLNETDNFQMKLENEELKKTIKKLQEQSLQEHNRAEQLRAELLQWRRRDQQEAQDLEDMVQSVEQNLRLMTRRALKAEASVSKLKTQVQHLQERLEEVQVENSSLRASDSEMILTMKQNALTASEKLQETSSSAQSCVRRLLSEAESLRFVSELLQSIDRMSSV